MNNKQSLLQIFKTFLVNPQIYQSSSHQRQSSVVLILKNPNNPQMRSNDKFEMLQQRINYFLQTQLLLLQRVVNNKPFSGDVCLPGGKMDKGETPLQAALRQTKEETNIQLRQDELLGTADRFFFVYSAGKIVQHICAYVFFVDRQLKVTLNQQEMTGFRWVPLKELKPGNPIQFLKIGFRLPQVLQANSKGIQKHISHIQWPSIDVKMSKNLWGLTLYIVGYFANSLVKPILSLYIKLCVIQNKIMRKEYKIEQSKRHIFFRTKILLEQCLISAMGMKNLYFMGGKVELKQTSSLSDDQIEKQLGMFITKLRAYFPNAKF